MRLLLIVIGFFVTLFLIEFFVVLTWGEAGAVWFCIFCLVIVVPRVAHWAWRRFHGA